jgi:hypothetical protein
MRLPVGKVYRAFPELDQFSDEECIGYVKAIENDRRFLLKYTVAMLGTMFGGPALFSVTLAPFKTQVQSLHPYVAFTLVACLLVVWVVSALLVRDWMLRRALATRLMSARCPQCVYSLLGLQVFDGNVRCPECGETFNLVAHGLTPAQILVNPAVPVRVEGM